MEGCVARLTTAVKVKGYIFITLFGALCLFGLPNYNVPTVTEPVVRKILTSIIVREVMNGTSTNLTKRARWTPETEVRHIAFLKVHKTASSTVLNIMYRFGRRRNLNLVLPKHGNYLDLHTPNIIPLPVNETYDILCNHVKFNYTLFTKILPTDSFYIGIVREPLERLHSAFWYYIYEYPNYYLTKVSSTFRTHTFENYLQDPFRFEPSKASKSQTNNRMAIDFGYDEKLFNDTSQFSSYIHHLDSVLDLVLVTEYFDESLVLLRRYLKWPLKDILHLSQNRQKQKPKLSLNATLLIKAKEYLVLDYMLYDHYLAIFRDHLKVEGEGFQIELKYFKRINQICADFCLTATNAKTLQFSESSLSESFNVTYEDCTLMEKEEFEFLNFIRDQGKREFNPWLFFATHSEYYI